MPRVEPKPVPSWLGLPTRMAFRTAPLGNAVERNFSGCRQKRTGHPPSHADQAQRQNFGDLGEALVRAHVVWLHGGHGRRCGLDVGSRFALERARVVLRPSGSAVKITTRGEGQTGSYWLLPQT